MKGAIMNQKENKYLEIINTWMKESEQNQAFFEEDDRLDEANLEKIKYNIYDIFQKMFHRSKKISKNEDEFINTYLMFHQKIPTNWKRNYEQAKEDESIDMYIEEIKLETATKIEQVFRSLWCEDGSH